MRAALVVLFATATAYADRPVGFDHRIHDRQIIINGGSALTCARCHVEVAGKLVGRPDHKNCFGECHGPPPPPPRLGAKLVRNDDRVCTACHAPSVVEAAYAGAAPVAYPPYTIDRDFTTAFSHRRHRDTACTACHDGGGAKAGNAHRRCAGCHDGGKTVAMTACTACHTPGSGTPLPPHLFSVALPVTPAFSHAKHAARGGAGKQCATCHAELRETDDVVLPQPKAATCAVASCHDGRAAFAVTVACTRCHREPPVKTWEVARPDKRFSHARHRDRDPGHWIPCATCHPLSAHGEAETAGHEPCVPCHAKDFGEREPQYCGACHNSTEPWRPLTVDRRPPDHTEFGARIDHRTHKAACASCHKLTTSQQQLRPPRGHAACTGSGCHARTGGPRPTLAACNGCHDLGLVTRREEARAKTAWSARATFDHSVHPGGCDGCHDMTDAASIDTLATPPKATCAPCHDGNAAFDLTGTTCTRCHGGKR
jgi:c(7)-type cytochrome triheme protein